MIKVWKPYYFLRRFQNFEQKRLKMGISTQTAHSNFSTTKDAQNLSVPFGCQYSFQANLFFLENQCTKDNFCMNISWHWSHLVQYEGEIREKSWFYLKNGLLQKILRPKMKVAGWPENFRPGPKISKSVSTKHSWCWQQFGAL